MMYTRLRRWVRDFLLSRRGETVRPDTAPVRLSRNQCPGAIRAMTSRPSSDRELSGTLISEGTVLIRNKSERWPQIGSAMTIMRKICELGGSQETIPYCGG